MGYFSCTWYNCTILLRFNSFDICFLYSVYVQLLTELQELVSCLVNGEYLKALTTPAALKFFGETPETSDETTEGTSCI